MCVGRHRGFAVMPIILLLLTAQGQQQSPPVVIKGEGPSVSPRADEIKPQPGPADMPPETIEKMTYPELRFSLMKRFGSPWYCDPDVYPLARKVRQEAGAVKHFPEIRENAPAFHLIAKHLNLDERAELSTEQKVLVYHEYKKVQRAMQLEPDGSGFRFAFSVPEQPTEFYRARGFRIVGRVDSRGEIVDWEKTPATLACPI